MLPKKYRLTKDWRIRQILRKGRSIHTRYFVINWLGSQNKSVRVAFVASKKVGNAVKRNRSLRLLRETVRLLVEIVPAGMDYVFVARKGADTEKVFEVKRVLEGIIGSIKSN